MSAVDASALNRLSRRLLAASNSAPKELEAVARQGQRLAVSELKRTVRGKYNLTPAKLRQIKAKAAGKYGISISGSERPVMVNRGYRATQSKAGLRYSIEKGTRLLLPTGFISKNKKYALKRLGPNRLPIVPVTGPGVGTIIANTEFVAPAITKIVEVLTARVTTRIERVINRGG